MPLSSLGVDLATPPAYRGDCTERLSTVTGPALVAQALARRLRVPRGGLYTDPRYGFALRKYVNSALNASDSAKLFEIESGVRDQAKQDERVLSVDITIEVEDIPEAKVTKKLLRVTVDGVTAEGPFRLVMAISEVTTEVLIS